jgi:hypothetical protein
MSLNVHPAGGSGVPVPAPGARPCRTPCVRRSAERSDSIAPPAARRALPVAPAPKHPVDGTPEVLAAGIALGGAAVGLDVAAGAGAALRPAASYVAQLTQSIGRCLSNPVTTGEHIAEGVVGGAAWAAAATGVVALADAARSRLAHGPR